MKRVYLDNGSTSYPKAPGVSDAVKNFMDNIGTNVNRGGYEEAYAAEDIIIETREKLCKLFHFDKLRNVIFTPSITYSLNYIIKGYLRAGDHVLVSSLEHNAMMRPLNQMVDCGVTFDRIPCTRNGEMMVEKIEEMIRPNTKAIMMLQASDAFVFSSKQFPTEPEQIVRLFVHLISQKIAELFPCAVDSNAIMVGFRSYSLSFLLCLVNHFSLIFV